MPAGLAPEIGGFVAETDGLEMAAGLFGVEVVGFFKAGEPVLAVVEPLIPAVPRYGIARDGVLGLEPDAAGVGAGRVPFGRAAGASPSFRMTLG